MYVQLRGMRDMNLTTCTWMKYLSQLVGLYNIMYVLYKLCTARWTTRTIESENSSHCHENNAKDNNHQWISSDWGQEGEQPSHPIQTAPQHFHNHTRKIFCLCYIADMEAEHTHMYRSIYVHRLHHTHTHTHTCPSQPHPPNHCLLTVMFTTMTFRVDNNYPIAGKSYELSTTHTVA